MKNPLSVFTRSAGQSTLEAYMFVHRSSRGKPHTEILTLSLIKATGSSSTSVVQTGIQMLALVTTSVVSIFTFRVIKSLSFNSINTFRHSQEWWSTWWRFARKPRWHGWWRKPLGKYTEVHWSTNDWFISISSDWTMEAQAGTQMLATVTTCEWLYQMKDTIDSNDVLYSCYISK